MDLNPLHELKKIEASVGHGVEKVGQVLDGAAKEVAPFIQQKVQALLLQAAEDVWQAAYPLAEAIVKDFSQGIHAGMSGLDKHAASVAALKAALLKDGKFVAQGALTIATSSLGQIILAAFANLAL